MKILRSLLLCCLLLFNAFAKAQTTGFIHYGVEHGLAQSQVQTIVQDLDGNLWVGTLSGLSKFNGKTFENYSRKDGLAEDWVISSCLDSKGNVWFGHWGGGVSFYDSKSRVISNLKLETYSEFKSVKKILEDAQGNIWFATDGAGLFRYNIGSNKIEKVGLKEGYGNEKISSFTLDPYGNLWMGTDNGLIILNPKAPINSASFKKFEKGSGLVSNNVTAVSNILKDELWVGSGDAGIRVYKLNSNTNVFKLDSLSQLTITDINSNGGLSSNHIQTIYQDGNSNVWIGTADGGVVKFNPAELNSNNAGIQRGTLRTYTSRQGLNYNNVNAVTEDREGNLWIGTDLGLNFYSGERLQIYDEQDGLPNNIVWSVLSDSKNSLWLGTNDGLSKVNFEQLSGGNPKPSIVNYSEKNGLVSNIIFSLFEDSKGNIWVGTAGSGGLSMMPAGSDRFQAVKGVGELGINTVFSINEDTGGNIWFGTEKGAHMINAAGEIKTYGLREGLGGNYVYRIYKDKKDRLWFGLLGGYLTVYENGTFRQFDESTGLKHRFILCMTEDKQGNLWLGVYGGGLYIFKNDKFENINSKEGLLSDSPYSLICDEDNFLWMGTSRGIDKYDPKTGRIVHYGKQEGFLGVEANANALTKDADGNLWFGTIMGVVKFNPKEDRANTKEPVTRIDGLKIFFKKAEFGPNGKFEYNQNHLTFQFAGVSLTNADKVMFSYKLDGFDEQWSPPSTANEAVYSNLAPGKYKLLVKSCNSEGVWNKAPVAYEFSITPPFWQTWWFKILTIAGVTFLLLGLIRLRTRSLHESKKQLELKVRERTMELANKNTELAKKNKDITDSINYAKRIQEAILPDQKKVAKAFPNSFILYKPKDIVSGDFYFFAEKNNKIIIGSVDCTGHGVPGALMSMIGANFLNNIVGEMGITDPAMILNELHKKVSDTLKNDIAETKDGMDLGLITLDTITNRLEFAGAVRPLYILSNNGLKEIKGSRFSVGGAMDAANYSFESQSITISPNDAFYLFTDGIVDQFGGDKGKKFMSQRFKELLMEIKGLPMVEQKVAIDQRLSDWKGEYEQVDDILIVGVKVL